MGEGSAVVAVLSHGWFTRQIAGLTWLCTLSFVEGYRYLNIFAINPIYCDLQKFCPSGGKGLFFFLNASGIN